LIPEKQKPRASDVCRGGRDRASCGSPIQSRRDSADRRPMCCEFSYLLDGRKFFLPPGDPGWTGVLLMM
jgi:hypothetical protein